MLLSHNDPFRDLDLLFRGPRTGTSTNSMPLDAYQRGDDVWVHIDLPGVTADSIDIDVERSVLTIAAERDWQPEEGDKLFLTERPRGSFRRQVNLGDSLDTEGIEADYSDGVLTLRIPVSPQSKPRKIQVGVGRNEIDVESAESS